MVKWVVSSLLLVALGIYSAAALSAVSAQLSAQNIDELETVRLTIKITETRQSQTLDLSALEQDFHVMSTNTISQSRFLNGRGMSWVDYQITLQPKRTGTLTIPSIEVGGERTPTLELRVRPLSAQTRQTISELVFFENEVSADTIYVQSQLILTRRLLYSQGVQLYSDLPGAPEIADAVVLTLGETSSGTTERNGKPYGVVQQRYAIFPETSGTFKVPGISITASVRLIENGRVARKGVRVGTDTKTINVLPVPAAYPTGEPWLPATNVVLHEVVSPERQAHEVGDTLTHELLIHVEGNVGSSAPPLALDLAADSFRTYPTAPVIKDDSNGDTVKGSRLQTNSIVPLKPGLLALPASKIVWWDTASNQVRVTRITAPTLSVTGDAVTSSDEPDVSSTAPASTPADAAVEQSREFEWRTFGLYGLQLAALLLAILGSVKLFKVARAWRPRKSSVEAKYRQLSEAISYGDTHQVYQALTTYLSHLYACPAQQALQRFRSQSEAGAKALDAISETLYGTTPAATDPAANMDRLQGAIKALRAPQRSRHSSPALPELYAQTS